MIRNTKFAFIIILFSICFLNCEQDNDNTIIDNGEIKGYKLLEDLTGHWVGTNETAYGTFDWFAFDFRPISASHTHSIYEGGSNQNIITSVFLADFEGKQQIMARNGGWLGSQYRATYFVLDRSEITNGVTYYRLVDAVGGVQRSYMEFRFENNTMQFDAYKDNSGTLDDPIHHMGFSGSNYNPTYAQTAKDLFNFPQEISEVNLDNQFNNLIDPNSALFLEENLDPFPKSDHGHISDLTINIERDPSISNEDLLLYISTEPIVNSNGVVDFENLDRKVVRTIDVKSTESFYTTTYLHPDDYYVTLFSDLDNNFYPSSGDFSHESKAISVAPDSTPNMDVVVDMSL